MTPDSRPDRISRAAVALAVGCIVVGVGPYGEVSAATEGAAPIESILPSTEPEVVDDRYVVHFAPGGFGISLKADDPRVVQYARDSAADAISDDVESEGGRLVHDFEDLPYLAIRTDDPDAVEAIDGVVDVRPLISVTRSLDTSLDVIDASDVDMSAAIGGTTADGTGVAVAIIDDGIDRTHPFFATNGTSRVVAEACFTYGECPSADGRFAEGVGAAAHHPGDYHGTHVAGIAAGNSYGVGPVARGVAGNADIVAVRVIQQSGFTDEILIEQALMWVRDQVVAGTLNVAAINMSLGSKRAQDEQTCEQASPVASRVDELADLGVIVVVASGNAGETGRIAWPACVPGVVPVGSTDAADQVSNFSNIGPQIASRGVVAPGSSIVSSVPSSTDSSGYVSFSGTSMAAPHVAGLAALIRQAAPDATVEEVRAALRTTDILVDDDRFSGFIDDLPRVDAWRALGAVLPDQGEVTGTVDLVCGSTEPLADQLLDVVLSPTDPSSGSVTSTAQVSTDSTGRYRIRMPAGDWTIEFSLGDGGRSEPSSVIVVAEGSTTHDPDVYARCGSVTGAIALPAVVGAPATFADDDVFDIVLVPVDAPAGRQSISSSTNLSATGGVFTIDGVEPGEWTLTGESFGHTPVNMTSIVVAPETPTDLGSTTLVPRVTVSSVSPTLGSTNGGTDVTITGRYLAGVTSVTFGSTPADPTSIRVVDDRRITVRAPASSAGVVGLIVTAPLGTTTVPSAFVFQSPQPVVVPGGGGGGAWPATTTVSAPASGDVSLVLRPSVGEVEIRIRGASGDGRITVEPRFGPPTSDARGIVLPFGWVEITTTLRTFRDVEVCLPFRDFDTTAYGITVDDLRLFHWVDGRRVDVTTRVDVSKRQVCGTATSFSPFAIGAPATPRVAGVDRYATAAELSQYVFDSGAPVVYVVTGEKFPDALAAGAAAGRDDAPVLLTRFGSLPTRTVDELKRLMPRRVIVVGGPAVISDDVVAAIRRVVGSVPIDRIWGPDRYATSARLSASRFASAQKVYIGSGVGFTEILAASAAAGRDGAPLLLVPGSGVGAGLPLDVAVELVRLRPTEIVVVGGASIVSPAIVDAVRRFLPTSKITQIGGVDAYDVAAKVARTFAANQTVYVATGEVFADGLAGGAAAAVRGEALIVVPSSGRLPAGTESALSALRPSRIVLLGGPRAIDHQIASALARFLPA